MRVSPEKCVYLLYVVAALSNLRGIWAGQGLWQRAKYGALRLPKEVAEAFSVLDCAKRLAKRCNAHEVGVTVRLGEGALEDDVLLRVEDLSRLIWGSWHVPVMDRYSGLVFGC